MTDTGAAPPTGPSEDHHRGGGEGQRGRGRGNRGPGRGRGRGDGAASSHRGGRGRGRGGNHHNTNLPAPEDHEGGPKLAPGAKEALLRPSQPKPKTEAGEGADDANDDDDDNVCFICANPIQHHAVAPCNHITCHICALRMRALYKNKDCPHCRTAAPFVIFTDDATKRFDEYAAADITSADENIGIRYTNEDIVGDTVLLLRYNCPDMNCDVAALGWPDLHRHVRSTHHKKMCDLCTRNKKVFTHEHELFTDKELSKHMAHGDDKPGDVAQTGFRGHPLCVFCGERFYDDDKLYDHCRHKHERCFICDRRDSRTPHYYQNYNALEKHFKDDHYICLDRECLEKKFVVFDSEIDLKAHQLAEHGGSMSKDVRRDARVVDISGFDYRQPHQEERRGGRSGGGREARGRGRDPNAEALPRTSAQPLSRAELALQRQTQHAERAVHSAQSISTRTFGGQLTQPTVTPAASRSNGAPASSSSSRTAPPPTDSFANLSVTEQANLPPAERARLLRHSAVIERAAQLLGNDATKLATFRTHISSFKSGTMTASLLIDAFFALFADTSASALGTLVREVAELFEDKAKADALRKAWQDWRAINEDYPSLPGLGGMHGATTSSSGWASAAAAGPSLHNGGGAGAAAREKHTTRVLKLKNSTLRGSATGGGGGGVPGSGPAAAAVVGSVQWANSAQARGTAPASSSAAFPALPPVGGKGGKAKPAPTPFWIGGSGSQQPMASSSSSSSLSTATRPSGGNTSTPAARRAPAPIKNVTEFPGLPPAKKMETTISTPNGRGRLVRSDFGVKKDTGFSWGGEQEDGGAVDEEGAAGGAGEEGEEVGGKGKKKKGKGKGKVLVAWG